MSIFEIKTSLVLILLTISFNASAEDSDVCEEVYLVAASAVNNKTKGVSKKAMKKALPPLDSSPNTELLRSMHEILDEVYDYEELDPQIYSVYRSEICFRRINEKETPTDFSLSHPKLQECSKISDKKIECAMGVAGSS